MADLKLGTPVPHSDTCLACGAAEDWHPDPSGPNGETWMVCEACGFMRDHQGKVASEGSVADTFPAPLRGNQLTGEGAPTDFECLRRERNAAVEKSLAKLADDEGIPLQSLRHNFNPNACYCACPEGPCEHQWDGGWWRSEDGCSCSATCSRCGITAMSHSLRVGP